MATIPTTSTTVKTDTTTVVSPGNPDIRIVQTKYFSFSKLNENEYTRVGSPNKIIPGTISAVERGHVYDVSYRISTVHISNKYRIFDKEAVNLVAGLSSIRNGNSSLKSMGEAAERVEAYDYSFTMSYRDYVYFHSAVKEIGGRIEDHGAMQTYMDHCAKETKADWPGLMVFLWEVIECIDATAADAGAEVWNGLHSAMEDGMHTWDKYTGSGVDAIRSKLPQAMVSGLDSIFKQKAPEVETKPDGPINRVVTRGTANYYLALTKARSELYSKGITPKEYVGRNLQDELDRLSKAFPVLSSFTAISNSEMGMLTKDGDKIRVVGTGEEVSTELELGAKKREDLYGVPAPAIKTGRMLDF